MMVCHDINTNIYTKAVFFYVYIYIAVRVVHNPKSLHASCKKAINKRLLETMHTNKLHQVYTLPLPQAIKDYLMGKFTHVYFLHLHIKWINPTIKLFFFPQNIYQPA